MSEVSMDDHDVAIVVGMFLDMPPEGSVQTECDDCGTSITLGPNQQKAMAQNPDTEFWKVCVRCLVKLQAEQAAEGNPLDANNVHQAKDILR